MKHVRYILIVSLVARGACAGWEHFPISSTYAGSGKSWNEVLTNCDPIPQLWSGSVERVLWTGMLTNNYLIPSWQPHVVDFGVTNFTKTNFFSGYDTNGTRITNKIVITNVCPASTTIWVNLFLDGFGPYELTYTNNLGAEIEATICPVIGIDKTYYTPSSAGGAQYATLFNQCAMQALISGDSSMSEVYWTYDYDWPTWFEAHTNAGTFPDLYNFQAGQAEGGQSLGILAHQYPDLNMIDIPTALFDDESNCTNEYASLPVAYSMNAPAGAGERIVFGSLAYTGGTSWVWNDGVTAPSGYWTGMVESVKAVYQATSAPASSFDIQIYGADRTQNNGIQNNYTEDPFPVSISDLTNSVSFYWYDIVNATCSDTNQPIGTAITLQWSDVPAEFLPCDLNPHMEAFRLCSEHIDLSYRILRKLNWSVSHRVTITTSNALMWIGSVTDTVDHAVESCRAADSIPMSSVALGAYTEVMEMGSGYLAWAFSAPATLVVELPPTNAVYEQEYWVTMGNIGAFSAQGQTPHGKMLKGSGSGATSDVFGVTNCPPSFPSDVGSMGWVARDAMVLRKFSFEYTGDF